MIEFPSHIGVRDPAQWMAQLKDALDDRFKSGVGSPEGVVTANIGCQYINTSGGASTTIWVKEAGDGLNTGWTAK